jgi:hypothetical protein
MTSVVSLPPVFIFLSTLFVRSSEVQQLWLSFACPNFIIAYSLLTPREKSEAWSQFIAAEEQDFLL